MLSMDCYYKEFVIYLVCVVFAVECCQCSLGIRIFFIDYVEHIVECIPSWSIITFSGILSACVA